MMIAASLLFVLLTAQPAEPGNVVIPQLNRPANFSGAAGVYRIEMQAKPTNVRVEDPITLTVKIISSQSGKPQHPPQRDKLRLIPARMESDFFIEPLPEDDRILAGENAWEFSWRLMPKHLRVKQIPALEFVYYHTAGIADFKAADGARSIALEVKPRPTFTPTAPDGARDKFRHIVEGDALLTRATRPVTRVVFAVGGLVLPPVFCFTAFFLWRHFFPEAAVRLRRQRSRALRKALKQLHKLGPSANPSQVRNVVTEYLSLHVSLALGGPTPPEAKDALLLRRLSVATASEAARFLENCDAALFAPAQLTRTEDLKVDAQRLLQNLEGELCALASR